MWVMIYKISYLLNKKKKHLQEEIDVLENQLEENDPVKNNYGELCGESLLESCYTVLPKIIKKPEIISSALSFLQFQAEAIESAVHNNQIKNLCSEHEEILQRYYYNILFLIDKLINFIN